MNKIKKSLAVSLGAVAVTGLMAFGPASPANAYSGSTGKGCTTYQYSRGGYSTCIANIQRMLNGINQSYGTSYGGYALAVDNAFGPNTETQVRRFQSWARLTSDGIVGANTWNKLCFYAGQVNFSYSDVGATKNAAWQAAYDAGCYVEKKSSTPPYYTTISKY